MDDVEALEDGARPFALYPLRIGLAAVFMANGWLKFTQFGPWADFLASQGVPLATTLAFLVAVAELLGGVGLLLGVLTRFTSAVLTVVLVNAIYLARWDEGFVGGWEFDLALIAGLLTLLVNGPGRPTIWSTMEEPRDAVWMRIKKKLGRAEGS